MKNIWKKYGKIVVAAVFLTVAGLYYGFVVRREDLIRLGQDGSSISSMVKEAEMSLSGTETFLISLKVFAL